MSDYLEGKRNSKGNKSMTFETSYSDSPKFVKVRKMFIQIDPKNDEFDHKSLKTPQANKF